MEVGWRKPKAKLEAARTGSVELIAKEKEKVVTVLAVVAELRVGSRSKKEIGGFCEVLRGPHNCKSIIFQVRKCNTATCPYHEPIRGAHEVEICPDPVPKEVD